MWGEISILHLFLHILSPAVETIHEIETKVVEEGSLVLTKVEESLGLIQNTTTGLMTLRGTPVHMLNQEGILFCDVCVGLKMDYLLITQQEDLGGFKYSYTCECPLDVWRRQPQNVTTIVHGYIFDHSHCRLPIPLGVFIIEGEPTTREIDLLGKPLKLVDAIAEERKAMQLPEEQIATTSLHHNNAI